MMKALINYKYRRMAQSTKDKCQLPLLMLSSDNAKDDFLKEFHSITNQVNLHFSDEGKYSSVWVSLPSNTILDLAGEGIFLRILQLNNKLSDLNFSKYEVYIQNSHIEAIPSRYDVQQLEDGDGFYILRYNFSFNYYVPIQKLPYFRTESEAWSYIKDYLPDW